MRKKSLIALISFFLVASVWAVTTKTQTDWTGGPGVAGPVTNWGTRFWDATAVNYKYSPSLYLSYVPQFPGTRHHVGNRNELYAAQTGDVDGDGDPDIVVGGHNSGIVWYENLGGGNFNPTPQMILNYAWPSFHVFDLNKDGYADIIYTNDQYIYWYENNHSGWNQHQISPYFNEVDGTGCADFDRDGDADIVAGACQANTDLRWYENNGAQTFTQRIIRTGYEGPNNAPLATGDLDGDGWPDFVISSEFGNFLEWWENSGTTPVTFTAHRLLNNYNGSRNSFIEDVDGDGDNDILSAAINSNSIDWWENNGAATPAFTRHNIASGYGGGYDIVGFDADYDGDTDILTTAQTGDTLDWWQNDGHQVFTRGIIASGYNGASSIWVDDVNRDGIRDIVSSALDAGSADWWNITYGYRNSGELTSSIMNTGGNPAWGYISWHGSTPTSTSIRFQVRASNNSSNMGNWSSDITVSGSSLQNYLTNGLRYFQYRARLLTTNTNVTPRLDDMRITYSTVTGILVDFTATGRKDDILLSWHADGTAEVAGFNIYRKPADAPEGNRIKVNASLICGSPPYSYADVPDGNGTYKYWLEAVTLNGAGETAGPVEARKGAATPSAFSLGQSKPNPARGKTIIAFSLPEKRDVALEIYDLAGRRIAAVTVGAYDAGYHEAVWDLAGVAPGVYVYTLRAGPDAAARKLVVVE